MTDTGKLTTIHGVELIEVGEEWQLSSGPFTATIESLQAAVEAVHNDPAVKAPRVKFGHTSDWGDAEPAFGRWENLRVENDGKTLVADLAGVPEWFAEVLPAAWPNRSFEGWTNATTHTGKTHDLIITAVSFLGVVLPGINTLEDLAAVWAAEPPEGTEVTAGTAIYATRGGGTVPKPVAGAVGVDDLRKEFYNDFAQGDRYYWWLRQIYLDPALVIVDDDETGGLWAVEYTANADGDVEFSDPQEVVTQYVYKDSGQVAAAAAHILAGGSADANYVTASESRIDNRKKEGDDVADKTTAATLDIERDDLIKRLKLDDDATDEQINEALLANIPEDGDDDDEQDGDDVDENDGTEDEEDGEDDEPKGDAQTAAQNERDAQFEDMKTRLAAHDKREASREKARRDEVVNAAIKEGRIARARGRAWRTTFDNDPEGTEKLLTASEEKGGLPKNMVPVEPSGVADGDPTTAGTADDAVQEGYYADHFPELARKG